MVTALVAAASTVAAQEDAAVGIAWEEVRYPHPVRFLPFVLEGQTVRMAYMDVAPVAGADSARQTVVLLHGRNFGGDYWSDIIERLTAAGYRVVVPDQIGFAKSAKPLITYTLDRLAESTIMLLDSLGVGAVSVVGHSMGGMLAVRRARAYPDRSGSSAGEASRARPSSRAGRRSTRGPINSSISSRSATSWTCSCNRRSW